jgi:alkylation response protein AidB-like acyl-CoA dehydrogenase
MPQASALTREQWLERARSLAPVVARHRDQGEEQRHLPQPVFEAMRAAHLFSMWVPGAFGGAEVDVETMALVTEELSRQDGSVGWNHMIAGNTAILWSLLAPETAAAMIGDDPDTVLAGTILAGAGTATAVAGGYRVSGRWPFASGCHQADWMCASCQIIEDGRPRSGPTGAPDVHAFVVPKADFKILDTWYTAGLRGTGSHDFQVTDVFVPADRFFRSVGGKSYQPGPLYNTMITNVWGFNVASVALGIARDALDSFAELAQTKTSSRNRDTVLRDREQVQTRLGEAEALRRSGRAFLFEACRETWALLSAGRPVPTEQAALNRLAYANATRNAVEAVDIVFTLAGSASIYATNRIERCFRDVHMVTQHGVVGPAGFTMAGRCFLGLETALR